MSFWQNQSSSWKHVISHDRNKGEVDDEDKLGDKYESHEEWGLLNFLESLELSDVFFVVGAEEKVVPAYKVILGASGSFPISSCNEDSIQLLGVDYLILHALLQYIYTGRTQDSVCSVLHVVTSIPSCKILKETCDRKFSRHFNYCTTASSDFVLLDETTFRDILQLEKNIHSIQIPVIEQLVTEVIEYLDAGMQQGNNQNIDGLVLRSFSTYAMGTTMELSTSQAHLMASISGSILY
ncbi:hypothetical protein GIB67_018183 [Kingdonia uniflora]|uniref:BTB domain-containing protein n=1 Tax=Kingdonia uniflora TaxID=39325 RepID=A0A7J7NMM1_9MAGN|nr:hypothetical protein GIB67_018183 [Kingdonia uniflora]